MTEHKKDLNWVLGTHSNERPPVVGSKLPIIKAKCVLCDEPMIVSGYGVDPRTMQSYKLDNTKNIAMECVIILARKITEAGESVVEAVKNGKLN